MRTSKNWYSIQITRHLMEDVFMERGRESGLEGATSEREEKTPSAKELKRREQKFERKSEGCDILEIKGRNDSKSRK